MCAARCSRCSPDGMPGGVPAGVGAEEIALPVRLFHLADVPEAFHKARGADPAIEVAQARRGR
jgi:hypothetical protein